MTTPHSSDLHRDHRNVGRTTEQMAQVPRTPVHGDSPQTPNRLRQRQPGDIGDDVNKYDHSPTKTVGDDIEYKNASASKASNRERDPAQPSSLPLQDSRQSGEMRGNGGRIDNSAPRQSEDIMIYKRNERELNQRNQASPQTNRANGTYSRAMTSIDHPSAIELDATEAAHSTALRNESAKPRRPKKAQALDEVAELTNDLIEKLQRSDAHCKKLENEVNELEKNLQDAHDFIFTLQPRRQVITPTEAADEFRTFCATVEEWVQTKLGDALDERRLRSPKDIVPEQAKRFMSLITPAGRESLKVPDTDEYHVLAAIMNFLCCEVFDKRFWCPIGPGAMEFLESIERNMQNLEPRRDLATIRSWRSETLIALTSGNEFPLQRQAHVKALATDLTNMLRIFLPGADKQELYNSLKPSIVLPATSLAHKFQISVDKFSVEWTPLYRKRVEDWDLSLYECQNLLPPKRVLKFPAARQGYHIRYLFDVCPGLQYHAIKADAYDAPKTLKVPKILVAATKTADGPYVTPFVPHGQFATLLGWLEEVRPKPKQHSRGIFGVTVT